MNFPSISLQINQIRLQFTKIYVKIFPKTIIIYK